MTLHGIDISAWNPVTSIKYATDFGMVKSTESTNYHSALHAAQTTALRNAGKLVGHYHFLHNTVDGKAQADYFLAHTTILPGDLIALDLEKNDGTQAQRMANALLFLREVKTRTKCAPMLYSYPDFLRQLRDAPLPAKEAHWSELHTYPLWIAEYNGKDTVDSADMYGWNVWTMHQNADQPYVDRDVFNGDRGVWARLAVPHTTPVPPKPKPVVKPVITITAPSSVTIKVTQK